jgi:uncharacterized RDD family membrane protein YckC
VKAIFVASIGLLWHEPIATMQIFVMKNGERLGPFSLEEVNRQLAAAILDPSDEAWYESAPGLRPLSSITGVIMPGGASSSAASLTIATPANTGSTAYAGFWIRALAYLIDTLILLVVSEIILLPLKVLPGDTALTFGALVPLLVCFTYMPAFWSSGLQATIGQMICGLKVVNAITGGRISVGQAFGRWLALLLSIGILFVGVIMVAFSERKRGLHDMLAGTYVVKRAG